MIGGPHHVATLLLAAGLWLGLHWNPVLAWLVSVNLVTAFAFWSDKRRAKAGSWRIPEAELLLLSFLGGWPAGLAASQILRHKTTKASFRASFWGMVALEIAILAGA